MQQLNILVTYKNKDLVTVARKVYTLQEYCSIIKNDLMHVISEVEDVFVDKYEGKNKEEWSVQDMQSFKRIRHKLLDSANDIQRIPQNIIEE